MREIRLSGSEGGEATAFPTPIVIGSDFDVALIDGLFPIRMATFSGLKNKDLSIHERIRQEYLADMAPCRILSASLSPHGYDLFEEIKKG